MRSSRAVELVPDIRPRFVSLLIETFLTPTLLVLIIVAVGVPCLAQSLDQLAVGPPPIRRIDPPSASATAKELENVGDALQTDKNYLDALDYYAAALAKDPKNPVLVNKMGLTQLTLHRYHDAKKSFEQAIRIKSDYSSAYANMGVLYYHYESYGKSIHYYDKAIALDKEQAVYYNNRGASYFAKKDFEKAMTDYAKAVELDPEILEHTGRGAAIQAKVPSPQDRARYEYVLAKLYAKNNMADRSLHYLRKAMEDGYKDIKDVYRDHEFSELRKDPRFTELMMSKPVSISN